MLSDLGGLLFRWNTSSFNSLVKEIWHQVPPVVCWALWKERNNWVSCTGAEPSFQVYRRAEEMIVSCGCIVWARDVGIGGSL